MKNIRYGRLVIVAILTIYSLFIIFRSYGQKETSFDSRVKQIERELENLDESNPAYAAKKAELEKIEASRLSKEDAEKKAAELTARLANLKQGSDEYKDVSRALFVVNAQIPSWYDEFPLNLGLDLRGGTEVSLRIVSSRQEAKVRDLTEKLATLSEGTDEYKETEESLNNETAQLERNIDDAVDIIRNRLNRQGISEIPVVKEGNNRIRIQLPGMDSDSAKNVIDTIKTAGKLEFRLVTTDKDDQRAWDEIQRINPAPNTTDICLSCGRALRPDEISANGYCKLHNEKLYDWLEQPAVIVDGSVKEPARSYLVAQDPNAITGESIEYARATPSTDNPLGYEVDFRMNNYGGSQAFARLTSENIGRGLAIVLDGKLRSAPTIQSEINGRGRITGNFTKKEAERLCVILREGSLPVDIEVEFENTVGPTLGEDSIRHGMQAIVAGLLIVLVFMLFYYLGAGVVTDIALFINMVFILSILIGMGAALTLPGIAGLILTVGMAVDANVLIFERIREELKKGLPLARAIDNGYERAFVTIVDANVTTLITAFILMGYGTDAVKGFGTMLTIGILCSMFTSLYVTRAFFHLLTDTSILKKLTMMQIVKAPKIDFVSKFKAAAFLSVTLIVVGLAVFIYRGDRNLSYDLAGGTFAHVNLDKEISMEEARQKANTIKASGFDGVDVQSFGLPGQNGFRSFMLRTSLTADNEKTSQGVTAESFKKAIADNFPVVTDGITEIAPLGDSVDGRPRWEFNVNLTTPRSPADIQKALSVTDLRDVSVRKTGAPRPERKSRTALVTLAIRKFDDAGKERSEPGQWQEALKAAITEVGGSIVAADGVGAASRATAASAADRLIAISAPLTLKKEATAEQLREALVGSAALSSVKVELTNLPAEAAPSAEAVEKVTILCSVPLVDSAGKSRDEVPAQEQFIRSQMGSLRQDGLIDYTEPFSRFSSVGPQVASEMQQKAIMALIFSMVAIFFYIWLRFQFRAAFGLGACLALLHDVLFTIGAIAVASEFFGMDISIDLTIVAALLTIVGYSLNDTIVVFDRIRENLRGGLSLGEVINQSINQTLSRTMLTSLTTLLVVIALLALGGEVIRGFAFSLLIGIFVGTYSSVFIAAPVLVVMADWNAKRKARESENSSK